MHTLYAPVLHKPVVVFSVSIGKCEGSGVAPRRGGTTGRSSAPVVFDGAGQLNTMSGYRTLKSLWSFINFVMSHADTKL